MPPVLEHLIHHTSLDKSRVRPGVALLSRRLSQLISRIKRTRRPAHDTKEDIGVLFHKVDLGAQIRLAALSISTSRLRVERLAFVLPQPGCERLEGVVDIICRAFSVCTTVVTVQVFVNVEDEICLASIRVRNVQEGRACLGRKLLRRRVRAAGDENHIIRRDLADGGHDGLHGLGPLRDRAQVVGLIHNAEDDLAVSSVLGRELGP